MLTQDNKLKQVKFFPQTASPQLKTYEERLADEIAYRQWPEPSPLPSEICSVLPLLPEQLPPALRGYVMDSAERLSAPVDYIAAAMIVALGSVTGRGCCIQPKANDDWTVYPNLWGMNIGRASAMKSPAMKQALEGLRVLEEEASKEYEELKRKYDSDEEVRSIKRANITEQLKKKNVSCENDVFEQSLLMQLESLNVEPPIQKRFYTQDATVEKQGEILRDNPRGFLLLRDELSGLLKSTEQRGRETDRAFYLEAWNGDGDFTVDRIGRGSIRIPNICLSVFGNITPEVLSMYVNQANSNGKNDDGFIQRIQIMVYPDNSTEFKNVDREPNYFEEQRVIKIFKYLSGEIPAPKNNKGIPFLKFSNEAQVLFDNWLHENWLKSKQCSQPAFESHITKYKKLMPSLSLIFQLVTDIDQNVYPQYVSVESTKLAIEWCLYLESHARRVYECEIIYGVKEAKLLLKRIAEHQIKTLDTVRDLYRKQWSGLKTPEAVKAGLKVLEDYGFVIVHEVMVKRKPTHLIEVNRLLL